MQNICPPMQVPGGDRPPSDREKTGRRGAADLAAGAEAHPFIIRHQPQGNNSSSSTIITQ